MGPIAISIARDINPSGWITGSGEVDGDIYDHGYVLVPVP